MDKALGTNSIYYLARPEKTLTDTRRVSGVHEDIQWRSSTHITKTS